MTDSKQKKTEHPLYVHILRKNCNNNNNNDNTDLNQGTSLHTGHVSKLIISRNISDAHSSWKLDEQPCITHMNTNQPHLRNHHIITLQKKENIQCRQKILGDTSERGKVFRVHSFPVNTDPMTGNGSSCNVKSYSFNTRHNLPITHNTPANESNENYEDQNINNKMVHHSSTNIVGSNNNEVLKMFPFFTVVNKKLKWSCSICGESHATRLSLSTHIKSHLLPWCRICLKVVNSNEQLLGHMEKKHPTEMESDQPETQLVTSKYGRRRRVYSPATLLPKRRFEMRK